MTTESAGARGLHGQLVAISGRLTSMSREEARELAVLAGARLVDRPSRTTTLLVIGQGSLPLDEDGRPTRSLQRARTLQREGAPIEIVSEAVFLDRLQLPERREDLRRLFTSAQIARILDVPPGHIRSWIRHDLIHPVKVVRRLPYFDFRQVATAKVLNQLTKDGVTPARIRRSLAQVRAWVAEPEQALAQLETIENGGAVLFRTVDGYLAEPSGQLRLDFQERAAGGASVEPSAQGWFERGIVAEELGRLEEAVRCYERALELEAGEPEVLFNLGNALYSLERKTEAAQRFVEATRADPEFIEAWNNLGNALGEIDLPNEALQAYRRALAIEPDYADAHFNLAETLAALGARAAAERHWRAYLVQDPWSSWAEVVRERLAAVE